MIATLAAALAIAIAFGAWQFHRAESLMENNIRLEQAVELQQAAITHQRTRVEQDAETIRQWGERNAEIQARTLVVTGEINRLRGAELQRSLAKPFEVGGDADTRRRAILLRLAEKTDRNPNGAAAAGGRHPAGAGGAGPG